MDTSQGKDETYFLSYIQWIGADAKTYKGKRLGISI